MSSMDTCRHTGHPPGCRWVPLVNTSTHGLLNTPITRSMAVCVVDKAGGAPVRSRPALWTTRLHNRSHEPFGARHNLIRRRPCRCKVPTTTEPPGGGGGGGGGSGVSPPGLFWDSRRQPPSRLDSISILSLCHVRYSSASPPAAPGHRRMRSGGTRRGLFSPRAPAGVVASATDGVTGPMRASFPSPPRRRLLLVGALFP